jgi:hypothetical protein
MTTEAVHDFLHCGIDRDVLKARCDLVDQLINFVDRAECLWEHSGQRGGGQQRVAELGTYKDVCEGAMFKKVRLHQHQPALIKHLANVNSVLHTHEFLRTTWRRNAYFLCHEDEKMGSPPLNIPVEELKLWVYEFGPVPSPSLNANAPTADVLGALGNAYHTFNVSRLRVRALDVIRDLLSNDDHFKYIDESIRRVEGQIRRALYDQMTAQLVNISMFGMLAGGTHLAKATQFLYNFNLRPHGSVGVTLIQYLTHEHRYPGYWMSKTETDLRADIDKRYAARIKNLKVDKLADLDVQQDGERSS